MRSFWRIVLVPLQLEKESDYFTRYTAQVLCEQSHFGAVHFNEIISILSLSSANERNHVFQIILIDYIAKENIVLQDAPQVTLRYSVT